MMTGLLYTPVSIYQMTRGALVLWVGLFSVMFLKRKLWLYQYVSRTQLSPFADTEHLVNTSRWLSLVTVMLGVSVVGLSGSLAKDTGKGGESLTSTAVRMLVREEPASEATVFIGESLDTTTSMLR